MGAAPIAPYPAVRRGRLLKVAVVVPDLIISGLLWLMVVALLPTEVAVGLLTGMLAISVVVVSGAAEGLAVRILYAARRPTPFEAGRLDAPLRVVASRSGVEDLRVLVSTLGEPVGCAGRRHVILHREVVDAFRVARLGDAEVAALIAHGVGRLRCGQPRLDLLVTLWTLPWALARGVVAGVGRRLAWVPLGPFAWRTRFVVGSIAVILETQAGRWPAPIVIAVVIALSYLMPCWRHAWHRHLCQVADRHAAELGLAQPLARFLRRLPPDADLTDRLALLSVTPMTGLRLMTPHRRWGSAHYSAARATSTEAVVVDDALRGRVLSRNRRARMAHAWSGRIKHSHESRMPREALVRPYARGLTGGEVRDEAGHGNPVDRSDVEPGHRL